MKFRNSILTGFVCFIATIAHAANPILFLPAVSPNSDSNYYQQGVGKPEPESSRTAPRFWAGLSYSYMQNDMKLHSCIEHTVWQGLDYVADTLTSDEISSVNSIARFTSNNQSITLEGGMVILGKPGKKWHIDGKIIIGLTQTKYTTYDKDKDVNDLVVTSPFSRLCTGVEFRFGYLISNHWGVMAIPLLTYAQGTAKQIDDRLNGPLLNFSQDLTEKSQTFLTRVNLMASYHAGPFTFSAGPGFYFAYNYRDYKNKLTNPSDGSTYSIEKRSVFYNKYFADASLSVDWRITSVLEVSLSGGIAKDIMVTPAILCHF